MMTRWLRGLKSRFALQNSRSRLRRSRASRSPVVAHVQPLEPRRLLTAVSFTGGTYTQTFDSLATTGTNLTWNNASTLAGWELYRQASPGTAITAYDAGTGSSGTGSFYSFGVAGTNPATDRAMGSLASGTAYFGSPSNGAVAGWMALGLTNNYGYSVNGFTINYDGEEWRKSNGTESLTLEYGFGTSFATVASWTAPGAAFNFTAPITTNPAGALDGNAAANRVAGLGGTINTAWGNGQTLWIRWADVNESGANKGLSVDNVSFTVPNQPPQAVSLMNTTASLPENTGTATPIKIADISVLDDGKGTNVLSVSGTNAGLFEIVGTELFLKAGTVLDSETNSTLLFTVEVDDVSVGSTPDASVPFTLSITDVAEATTTILDDGEQQVAFAGPWSTSNSVGRGSDLRYLNPASAAGTATWAFNGLLSGQYRVSATWPTGLGAAAATNAPFSIRETLTGVVLQAAAINENVEPNDLTDAGSMWEHLGLVTIQGSSLFVQLTNVGAETWVVADAIRIERVGAVPAAPEIVVMQVATAVTDGGSFDFGDTTTGTVISKSFTISNTGTTNLVLQPATVPAGFSITANFTANQTVAPGASATLTVQLDAASAGSYSGQLSFVTNDGDENPFNVTVSGDVVPPGNLPVIVDDGDGAFSLPSGNWETWTAGGRAGDLRYINSVGVANYPSNNLATAGVARWSFTSLPTGQYRVSATWPDPDGSSGRATNAPYTVLDNVGGATLATALRNQNQAADDRTDQGSDWEDLATVNITAG
ncbi:MAG TPA: choice-of-anchor D domain-containing protein, partial [Planctomycetaceae bacterium]|nr:choice-of-anchor D domain-containing protein [Planctomycetaceae bacterium]